jgi:hypothetical protein
MTGASVQPNQFTKARELGLPKPPTKNRYTMAEEQGLPKPPGANQFTTGKRTEHSEATKDKIRAEKAAALLESEVDGQTTLEDGRRASAKILMEYGKPKLASVEQTQVNQWDSMSEEEMKAMVRALITSHPELIREFAPGPEPVIKSA